MWLLSPPNPRLHDTRPGSRRFTRGRWNMVTYSQGGRAYSENQKLFVRDLGRLVGRIERRDTVGTWPHILKQKGPRHECNSHFCWGSKVYTMKYRYLESDLFLFTKILNIYSSPSIHELFPLFHSKKRVQIIGFIPRVEIVQHTRGVLCSLVNLVYRT